MIRIVNLRFKDAGELYEATCEDMDLIIGDALMVETSMGIELAFVADKPVEIMGNEVSDSVLHVLRYATDEELERYELKKVQEREAFDKCLELIKKHQLDMNLIDAVFAFDCKRVVFFFESDNLVDYRGLVKDLVEVFKVRIELRQIPSSK